jgi:hypothetical protein
MNKKTKLTVKTDADTINFAAVTAAVKDARRAAEAAARRHGRSIYVERYGRRIATPCNFVRSRGTQVYALGAQGGRTAPLADEPRDYTGTKRELVELVADIVAHHPACDAVQLAGGFDLSDTIQFDDYEPEVTTWSVTVWTRARGWVVEPHEA